MILLVGVNFDKTINYFSNYLVNKEVNFLFINIEDLCTTVKVKENHFLIKNTKIKYEDIKGVFNRMVASLDNVINNKIYMPNYALLTYVLDFELKNVINRPLTTGSNNSKLYQLSIINCKELRIPKCYLSANNLVNNLQQFKEEKQVYKSVSSYRSIVNSLTVEDRSKPITCPTLFQEEIKGTNYRVHVVDENVFSLKINSDSIDYRYNFNYIFREETDIPEVIKYECIRLTKELGLRIAGIDLIEKEGLFYVLEINTYPGYDCFEDYMQGTPISDSILKGMLN